ncbi:Lysine transporter LysE OS=Stutzerimonas stutzeri OX=316 GN=CXK95_14445 PE=4 SV=1 [Stutzerimonas stutzeri]
MAVGLSNPKDILFFLAFLPGFILPTQPFAPQALTLIAIWAVIDLCVLLAYSLLSRRLAGTGLVQRLLDILPGYFLVALGLVSCSLGVLRMLE